MDGILAQLLGAANAKGKHQMGAGPVDNNVLLAVSAALPPAYLEFMARHGPMQLFREGLGFLLIVLPMVTQEHDDDYGALFRFGSYDDAYCYFVLDDMQPGKESPVFAFMDGDLEPVAGSFSEWFTLAAKELLSQDQSRPGAGQPKPFSDQELKIVQVRIQFPWRVVECDGDSVVVDITNTSGAMLDCITLGVRSRDRKLNGAVKVDVRGLAPGESRRVRLDCYADLVDPALSTWTSCSYHIGE